MTNQSFAEWLSRHPQSKETLWVLQNCLGSILGFEHPLHIEAAQIWKQSIPLCEICKQDSRLCLCVAKKKYEDSKKECDRRKFKDHRFRDIVDPCWCGGIGVHHCPNKEPDPINASYSKSEINEKMQKIIDLIVEHLNDFPRISHEDSKWWQSKIDEVRKLFS